MTWVRNGASEKTIETRCAAKRPTAEWGCAVSGVLGFTLGLGLRPELDFGFLLKLWYEYEYGNRCATPTSMIMSI